MDTFRPTCLDGIRDGLLIRQKYKNLFRTRRLMLRRLIWSLPTSKLWATLTRLRTIFSTREWRMSPMRTIFSSLQDQLLFQFTTKGVIHGDTSFKSKLLDLFHVCVKWCNDPHLLLMVFIMNFATGKTNHGWYSSCILLQGRQIMVSSSMGEWPGMWTSWIVPLDPLHSTFFIVFVLRWQRKWTIQTSVSLTTQRGLISNSSQIFVAVIKQKSWRRKCAQLQLIKPALFHLFSHKSFFLGWLFGTQAISIKFWDQYVFCK